MSVIWSRTAREQLEEYADCIGRDNPGAAARWVAKLVAAAELAGRFPRMGRAILEFGDEDVRQVMVHSHRVVYRIVGEDIEIARIWHGARLLRESETGEEE